MRDFFGGWRRKIGCLMLVMACVFMIAWMRSLLFLDYISVTGWIVPGEKSSWMFLSSEVGLEWERRWDEFESKREIQIEWYSIAHRMNHRTPRSGRYDTDSHWEFCGFQTDKSETDGDFSCNWVVPYWSVVLPLTLLSTWLLLLSKPRQPKPQSPSQLDQETSVSHE